MLHLNINIYGLVMLCTSVIDIGSISMNGTGCKGGASNHIQKLPSSGYGILGNTLDLTFVDKGVFKFIYRLFF